MRAEEECSPESVMKLGISTGLFVARPDYQQLTHSASGQHQLKPGIAKTTFSSLSA